MPGTAVRPMGSAQGTHGLVNACLLRRVSSQDAPQPLLSAPGCEDSICLIATAGLSPFPPHMLWSVRSPKMKSCEDKTTSSRRDTQKHYRYWWIIFVTFWWDGESHVDWSWTLDPFLSLPGGRITGICVLSSLDWRTILKITNSPNLQTWVHPL